MKIQIWGFILCLLLSLPTIGNAQKLMVNGFVTTQASYDVDNDQLGFGIGNQSTVVNANINDRISFLGESIFAFVGSKSATGFSVFMDRIQIKYNYWGNHDILIGKFHTPVNYWNCLNSCHAMLFYPTISRPKLFSHQLLPIHETGISFRGEFLTDLNLGYDVTIGNGLGASSVEDNDKTKSILLSGHINPIYGLRVGVSYYKDRISSGKFGAVPLGTPPNTGILLEYPVNYDIISGTFAYFNNNFEFLSELSLANATQDTDAGLSESNSGFFIYAGYNFGKLIPYLRYDNLNFDSKEVYFNSSDQSDLVVGCRYEINYLATLKLEYKMGEISLPNSEQTNKIFFQVAVGF